MASIQKLVSNQSYATVCQNPLIFMSDGRLTEDGANACRFLNIDPVTLYVK